MGDVHYKRLFNLPDHSFLLFGPRGTGKTTWLRHILPDALWFDLLRTQAFLTLTRKPDSFRQQIEAMPKGSWVVVLEDNREHLRAIAAEIDRLGSDASDELKQAKAVLDAFEEDPERVCQDNVCVKLGDVLVAIDGINCESLAANNDTEWIPLAMALRKHLLNPLRPQEG